MKYIALIYVADNAPPAPTSAEFRPMMAAYKAATERFAADGVLVGGDALENASTATTVRVRGGRTETMDGPFAESKEQLVGFYLFECASL
ncbi:MAG: YciI family protein, partial [Rhizobiales bacterium]|nr:YciI family protein [Hyphomicrobiales bacterium]